MRIRIRAGQKHADPCGSGSETLICTQVKRPADAARAARVTDQRGRLVVSEGKGGP